MRTIENLKTTHLIVTEEIKIQSPTSNGTRDESGLRDNSARRLSAPSQAAFRTDADAVPGPLDTL
jgi:hypothetical protein